MTDDSFSSQIYGVFFHAYNRFKNELNIQDNRYAMFFEESSIFREVNIAYKYFLYFNLPFDTVIAQQIVPQLILEVSNENEDEKTHISALLK